MSNKLLNKIATTALGQKEKKPIIHEMLREWINDLDAKDADLTDQEFVTLTKLYGWFMPPAAKKPKTVFDLVQCFKADNDVRYYLNHVHSTGTMLEASNGNWAIRMPVEWKAGFYDAAYNKIDVDGKFPDIGRVVPGMISKNFIGAYSKDMMTVEVNDKGIPGYRIGESCIQTIYLDVLFAFSDKPLRFYQVESTETINCRKIPNAYRIGMDDHVELQLVIMPILMD